MRVGPSHPSLRAAPAEHAQQGIDNSNFRPLPGGLDVTSCPLIASPTPSAIYPETLIPLANHSWREGPQALCTATMAGRRATLRRPLAVKNYIDDDSDLEFEQDASVMYVMFEG